MVVAGSVLRWNDSAMMLYSLQINDQPVCEITMDVPLGLPVRPQLNSAWLMSVVVEAIQGYFESRDRGCFEDVVKA